MTVVLAAVDLKPTGRFVGRAARQLAQALDADCRAVFVRAAGSVEVPQLDDVRPCELVCVEGDPAKEIERAAADPSVVMVVVGARGAPGGPTPAGHVATAVVERARKPVVVVPAEPTRDVGRLDRVLIPLEGTTATSAPIVGIIGRLADAGVVPIVLHVFDVHTVPHFWDHVAHSAPCYALEFEARWWQAAHPVEVLLQRGEPARTVLEVAEQQDVDLIMLGWAQDLSPGHAAVVRRAIAHAHVPVLLVPVDPPQPGQVPEVTA